MNAFGKRARVRKWARGLLMTILLTLNCTKSAEMPLYMYKKKKNLLRNAEFVRRKNSNGKVQLKTPISIFIFRRRAFCWPKEKCFWNRFYGRQHAAISLHINSVLYLFFSRVYGRRARLLFLFSFRIGDYSVGVVDWNKTTITFPFK